MLDNESVKAIKLNSRGEAFEVQVPIIRLAKDKDEWGIFIRVCRQLNWIDHNPTPGRPRQGRKKGLGRNRAKARGKVKGGKNVTL